MHACMYVWIYVCMYARAYVCIIICNHLLQRRARAVLVPFAREARAPLAMLLIVIICYSINSHNRLFY